MRLRVQRAPGIPCALYYQRDKSSAKTSDASRRENAGAYLFGCLTIESEIATCPGSASTQWGSVLAAQAESRKIDVSPTLAIDRKPMARVRCITEMGMGVDVHGRDATKAARRAVSDAIRHSSLGFFRMLGKTANDMFVDVTIGVPDPGAVDTSAVAKELPYGTVKVTAVKGGLEIPAEQGGDAIIIANAAVIVSLDDATPG
jgi:uncharacterized protein (TIGR02058 family)